MIVRRRFQCLGHPHRTAEKVIKIGGERRKAMEYKTPILDVVGTASTLIQGPVGHPTDPSGSGLKIQDALHSRMEEE